MRHMRSRSGGVIAAVLGIVLILAVGAIVAVVLMGTYLAKNVRVEKVRTERGETVRIDTPAGSLRVAEGVGTDARRLGIPIYPGAELSDTSGKTAEFDVHFGDVDRQLNVAAARYTTTDSAEKVADYYRHELPHWMVTREHGSRFRMQLTEGGYKRIISISEHGARTEIALASVGEPGVN